MALPESAPKVTCTLSRPLQADGTQGMITSAHLQIDRGLVWAASGETLYSDPVPIDVNELTGGLSFEVIPVDAPGVLDLAGNMVEFWHYTLRISLRLAENTMKTVTYHFQPESGGETDLDLIAHDGAISNPAAVVAGQEVTVYVGGEGGGVDFTILSGGAP